MLNYGVVVLVYPNNNTLHSCFKLMRFATPDNFHRVADFPFDFLDWKCCVIPTSKIGSKRRIICEYAMKFSWHPVIRQVIPKNNALHGSPVIFPK